MEEPDIFDAVRRQGIDADDPEVRSAVRVVLEHMDSVRERAGDSTERLCMRAVVAALTFQLQHPDVDDMSTFEADLDSED